MAGPAGAASPDIGAGRPTRFEDGPGGAAAPVEPIEIGGELRQVIAAMEGFTTDPSTGAIFAWGGFGLPILALGGRGVISVTANWPLLPLMTWGLAGRAAAASLLLKSMFSGSAG